MFYAGWSKTNMITCLFKNNASTYTPVLCICILVILPQNMKNRGLNSTFSPKILKNGVENRKFFQISEKGGLNSTTLQKQGAKFYSRLKKDVGLYRGAYLLLTPNPSGARESGKDIEVSSKRMKFKRPVAARHWTFHYSDVIMSTIESQITSLMIVYVTVYSGTDQRKHQAPRHWPLWGEYTGESGQRWFR